MAQSVTQRAAGPLGLAVIDEVAQRPDVRAAAPDREAEQIALQAASPAAMRCRRSGTGIRAWAARWSTGVRRSRPPHIAGTAGPDPREAVLGRRRPLPRPRSAVPVMDARVGDRPRVRARDGVDAVQVVLVPQRGVAPGRAVEVLRALVGGSARLQRDVPHPPHVAARRPVHRLDEELAARAHIADRAAVQCSAMPEVPTGIAEKSPPTNQTSSAALPQTPRSWVLSRAKTSVHVAPSQRRLDAR